MIKDMRRHPDYIKAYNDTMEAMLSPGMPSFPYTATAAFWAGIGAFHVMGKISGQSPAQVTATLVEMVRAAESQVADMPDFKDMLDAED